ncbi:membrane protein of unknown function [Nitrospira sp. KM1]|uniref:VIT1/CCC1 transporter family protein n=1 Tax=Nitrospira sp. KM1 TaxID=1936990 RepID=UPI0013A74F69|nr:VIT1/CCC1 transporter family protein [Nitrospira sp. KM1]BCA55902.1 membrane protein of unknown function [Nitrospira sp. KM1]
MISTSSHDLHLARTLVLDELFDLSLYRQLKAMTGDCDVQDTLDKLVAVEEEHLRFWQDFFGLHTDRLDIGRRLKLRLLIFVCRLFGTGAIHLILEAIEVHGVRKYLTLWQAYKKEPLGEALRGILTDEFKHEDVMVTTLTERKISAEQIRNIFLGLNDGVVEILGAVSGFFGAFGNPTTVLIAACTTAVAGAFSMAAGAFLALNSEKEVKSTDLAKKIFLGEEPEQAIMEESPVVSGAVVGTAYIIGATVPVLPVLFGATNAVLSVATAGIMVVVVSTLLSFLSGMNVTRRILLNLVILTVAVGVSYSIGLLAQRFWGISV